MNDEVAKTQTEKDLDRLLNKAPLQVLIDIAEDERDTMDKCYRQALADYASTPYGTLHKTISLEKVIKYYKWNLKAERKLTKLKVQMESEI